ncbi:MAG TPA: glutamate--tRNA ligase [Candidatus Nanoarchaeia archaeon]|nr:glutamate--tRNA ligase [Candidatus Nanoarchaeia archaeon]
MKFDKSILLAALENAIKHDGKANANAVLGAILSKEPSLKKNIEKLRKDINDIVNNINNLTTEEQEIQFDNLGGEITEKKEEERKLPELKNVKGKVNTRIAPEPSKYLHVGHALIFIINSYYAYRYKGNCILRLEDTNPDKASKEYVDSIIEDLKWLRVKYDKVVFCSDNMDIYYKYAEVLVKKSRAFVCFCSRDIIKNLRSKKIRCECAKKSASDNLKEWKNMLNGKYKPEQANLRLVGKIDSDNAVLRDPSIFRISNTQHYSKGKKYIVWPLYDFENSIEDSIENITHVIRSKEFELRAELQNLIKDYLKLKKQEVIEIGRFNISGAITQGREIRELIESGKVSGWDDPQLVTIKALRRRGFVPEAFHELAKEVGLSKSETNIDVRILESISRRLIDKKVNRYFFVENPKKIKIKNAPKLNAQVPLHPEGNKGIRKFSTTDEFYVQDNLKKGQTYRFMHLFNFKDNKFISKELDRNLDAKLIHWIPANDNFVKVEIVMDDGSKLNGIAESSVRNLKVDDIVQFERFAFCRLDKKSKDKLVFYFAHK